MERSREKYFSDRRNSIAEALRYRTCKVGNGMTIRAPAMGRTGYP